MLPLLPLQTHAEETFGVLLTITSMSACAPVTGTVDSSSLSPGNSAAPAPAPAAARRLLAA